MTFEGVRGRSWSGDIAIDDVTIAKGGCFAPPTPAPPTPPPPPGTFHFKITESQCVILTDLRIKILHGYCI